MEIMQIIKSLVEKIKEKIIVIFDWIKNKKIFVFIFLGIFLIFLLFLVKNIIFRPKKKVEQKSEVKVKVEKLKRGDFTQEYSVMGSIKGTIENDLRFEIEGVLIKYNFKEGDKVKKGEAIASLDPRDAQSRLSYVENKYKSEKAAYMSALERLKVYEDLYKLKAISESKLQEVRYEVESIRQRVNSALAELELAQSNLQKTNLLAPSDGILAEIIIHPGEFVTPHDIVAKFVVKGDVNYEVEVPEKDINLISLGMQAKLICDAYPEKEFVGVVSEISPIVKERTRTVVVRIRVPNEEGLLRSGMFAKGKILLKEEKDKFAVLKDSVISLGEETKLLPILKPIPDKQNLGIVELRQIKTGADIGKCVIVEDGVYEGEYYITETSGELADGVVVEYMETQ